jgi:hypothetical protein
VCEAAAAAAAAECSAEHDSEFSVERMLGTALVLACLDRGYLLCKSSLKILVQRAEKAPWVTRPDRCVPSLLRVGAHLKTTATAELALFGDFFRAYAPCSGG